MIKLYIKSLISLAFMIFRIFVLDAGASPANGHGLLTLSKPSAADLLTTPGKSASLPGCSTN